MNGLTLLMLLVLAAVTAYAMTPTGRRWLGDCWEDEEEEPQ